MADTYIFRLRSLPGLPAVADALATPLDHLFSAVGLMDALVTFTPSDFLTTLVDELETITEEEAYAELFPSPDESPYTPLPPSWPVPEPIDIPSLFLGEEIWEYDLTALDEIQLALPGLDGTDLTVGVGESIRAKITIDKTDATRSKLELTVRASIRLDPTLLRPGVLADAEGGNGKTFVADSDPQPLIVNLGELSVTMHADGKLDVDIAGGSGLALPLDEATGRAVMIGTSGIVIQSADVDLNLNGDGARPEGAPEGWKGLLIRNAKLRVPALFDGVMPASGLGIGSSGVSGVIGYDPDPPLMVDGAFVPESTLLGVPGYIIEFKLTLQQNIPSASTIRGRLVIPFFDEVAEVKISIGLAGNVSVEVSGVGVLERDGLLRLVLESLELAYADGDFAIMLSGTLRPLLALGAPDTSWPAVAIRNMTIHADGRVDLDGGWLDLPEQYRLDLFGFPVELTRIGFGQTDAASDADIERWVGFSGSVKLADSVGLTGAVEGLRIYWHKNDPTDIRLALDGVAVGLKIPDVLALQGYVGLINTAEQRGFRGSVKLQLEAAKLNLDAELLCVKVGPKGSQYTAFYVFVNGEFPAGVPLGATNVAFYGFAGLFGHNVSPTKLTDRSKPDRTWYGWYLDLPVGVTDVKKWDVDSGNLALGAGVTLGTAADDGHAVNGKLLLVLLVPGPVLIMDGKVNLLSDRARLSDPASVPDFAALAVIDNRAGFFQINVDALYLKPPFGTKGAGRILDLKAGAEAFFDFHRGDAWHFYLGQDQPREKRVRATLLSLVKGDAYFMLTARALRLGFWVGYKNEWKFGRLSVGLDAWMAADAMLSWKPTQLEGQIQLEGSVELKAFGRGLSIQVQALLKGSTPTPFLVAGAFKVKINLPWPLPDPKATVNLEWRGPADAPPFPVIVGSASAEHLKVSECWALDKLPRYDFGHEANRSEKGFYTGLDDPAYPGADDATRERPIFAQVDYDEDRDEAELRGMPIVPLDAHLVLSFAKPVRDNTGLGHANAGVPVFAEQVGGYRLEYDLLRLELFSAPPGPGSAAWERVALRPSSVPGDRPDLLSGTWQLVTSGNDTTPNAKLILGSKTPSDWSRAQSGPMYWPWLDGHIPEVACPPSSPPSLRCVGWDDADPGTFCAAAFVKDGLTFAPSPPMEIVYRPLAAIGHALAAEVEGRLEITGLPYGTTRVELCLSLANAVVRAQAFHGADMVATLDTSGPAPEGRVVELRAPGPDKWFDRLVLDLVVGERFHLYCVCYVAPLNPERQAARDRFGASVETTRESWKRVDPILAPNRRYKLVVQSRARRTKGATPTDRTYKESIYFRTAQPPGVHAANVLGAPAPPGDATDLAFPKPGNAHEHYPERGPLKDLGPYVQYTVPAPGARAVYRAYDVGAYFNENYVESMYWSAGKPLQIQIVDNAGTPVAGLDNVWGKNPTLMLSRAEIEWLSGQNRSTVGGCIDPLFGAHLLPADEHLNASSPDLLLRPETQFTARLVADPARSGDALAPKHVVHAWSFITSRYADFRHHVGASDDRLWARELTAAQRDGLGPRAYGVHAPDAPSVFDQLAALVQGTAAEPWPGRRPSVLEWTALRSGGRVYGLLLHSPEPLAAERVTFGQPPDGPLHPHPVLLRGPWTPAPTEPRGVKLVAARLGSSSWSTSDEWVDLLVLADQPDVGGWRIVASGARSVDPGDDATVFYTFPAGTALREGTVVRVHAVGAADDPRPAIGVRHFYAARSAFAFDGTGDRLALVDRSGATVHRRSFVAPQDYSAVSFDLFWNADRTAAFVLLPKGTSDVGAWHDGSYRLTATFRRYLAEDPLAPVFKRDRDAAPEHANLDLVVGASARVFAPFVQKR